MAKAGSSHPSNSMGLLGHFHLPFAGYVTPKAVGQIRTTSFGKNLSGLHINQPSQGRSILYDAPWIDIRGS